MVTKERRIRWAGHVTCMGQMRNAYKISVGTSQASRPVERQRRWEDNIKIYIKKK
jgi:hypothetical protein